jgi:hypothetical protein
MSLLKKSELTLSQELLETNNNLEVKNDLNPSQNNYKKYKSLSLSPDKITDGEKGDAVPIFKSEALPINWAKLQNIESILQQISLTILLDYLNPQSKEKVIKISVDKSANI